MENYTYTLDATQCSVPIVTRPSRRSRPRTATTNTVTSVSRDGTRARPRVREKRTQQNWANPLTESLHLTEEPKCVVCNCLMDNLDLYYDHLMFDQTHNENVARAALANSSSRAKPAPPTQSLPSSSSSSIPYLTSEPGSPLEEQSSSPVMLT